LNLLLADPIIENRSTPNPCRTPNGKEDFNSSPLRDFAGGK
jgi:hypothetical protein